MTTKQIADDLESTVRQAAEKLRSLDAPTLAHRPSPDRWTIKQVIGHLIDSAANNHQRFIRGQFTDELVLTGYEQNQWVASQRYDEIPWDDLLEFWQRYNLHLAHVIRHARPELLGVRCRIGHYDPCTLQFLMEDYVVHMKHHLAKIAERVHPPVQATRPK